MRMPARPQNVHQARLLRLLRDEGPRSRAELGDVVRLSRSKLAVVAPFLVSGLAPAGRSADGTSWTPTTRRAGIAA